MAAFWRLNPCFSGTYSRSEFDPQLFANLVDVLILVLVEHTLGALSKRCSDERREVLILVLVEHTLGEQRDGSCLYLQGS